MVFLNISIQKCTFIYISLNPHQTLCHLWIKSQLCEFYCLSTQPYLKNNIFCNFTLAHLFLLLRPSLPGFSRSSPSPSFLQLETLQYFGCRQFFYLEKTLVVVSIAMGLENLYIAAIETWIFIHSKKTKKNPKDRKILESFFQKTLKKFIDPKVRDIMYRCVIQNCWIHFQ